jgi:hypothetical protein
MTFMKRLLLLFLANLFIVSIASSQSILPPPTNLTVSNVTDSSFVAHWSPGIGPLLYLVDLSTSSNFSKGNVFIGRGTPFTSDTTISLQAGTTYYFRVRAKSGTAVSANSVIRSLVLVPPAPRLNGVVTAGFTEVGLSWQTTKGTTGYRVDVARNNNFDSLVYSNLDARNNTFLSITNLQRGRLYSFRVRAVNSYGTSKNSNVTSFRMPVEIPVTLPATNITTHGFTANWSFALHGPTVHYRVWARKDSTYVFTTEVVGVTSVNVPVTGGLYYYGVYAYIIGDWGITNSSNETQVRVPFPTPSANSISVYPNPVKDSEYVYLNLKDLAPRADVKVDVTSLSGDGKTSIQYDFVADNDGVLNSRIAVSSLKAGTYILKANDLSYRFVVE